jgi:hypothetical protein
MINHVYLMCSLLFGHIHMSVNLLARSRWWAHSSDIFLHPLGTLLFIYLYPLCQAGKCLLPLCISSHILESQIKNKVYTPSFVWILSLSIIMGDSHKPGVYIISSFHFTAEEHSTDSAVCFFIFTCLWTFGLVLALGYSK